MALYTTTNRRLNQIIHSSRSASYTIGLITLFIVVLMIFLAIMPAYKSITDQLASNEAKTIYLNDLTTKKNTMDRLLREYEQFSDQINLFNEYQQVRANNELVVANMDRLARDYSVNLISSNYEKEVPPKNEPYSKIVGLMAQPFTLSFKGELANLENLLAKLEQYPTLLSFKTISYNHGETSTAGATGVALSGDRTFTLSLNGEYYFWKATAQ